MITIDFLSSSQIVRSSLIHQRLRTVEIDEVPPAVQFGNHKYDSLKLAAVMDVRAKLERSRQSARECRARKKLRYQYLEELVSEREKAVLALRKELEKYKNWYKELDEGRLPDGFETFLEEFGAIKQEG